MVLVFYKNLGSNMHSSNGSLYSRGGAVDQVSFSFVANYRQCQIVSSAVAALLSSRLHSSSSNPLWIDGYAAGHPSQLSLQKS